MSDWPKQAQIRSFGEGEPLLLLHSWWGVTPAIIEWAEFLATQNYKVLVPDLYAGKIAQTIADAETLAEKTLRDSQTYQTLEHLAAILASQNKSWSVMGFSLGAFLACHLAGGGVHSPTNLILFYGGQAPPGDSSRIRKLELHFVPNDEYFTAEEFSDMREGFTSTETQLEIYSYDDNHHWFAERGAPNFDENACEIARSRISLGCNT